MSTLARLTKWYFSQCDGDWEHGYGIIIDTLDNPGWRLKVNLIDTDLELKAFQRTEIERSDNDWLQCWVKEGIFLGACGPENLEEMLLIFCEWSDIGS